MGLLASGDEVTVMREKPVDQKASLLTSCNQRFLSSTPNSIRKTRDSVMDSIYEHPDVRKTRYTDA